MPEPMTVYGSRRNAVWSVVADAFVFAVLGFTVVGMGACLLLFEVWPRYQYLYAPLFAVLAIAYAGPPGVRAPLQKRRKPPARGRDKLLLATSGAVHANAMPMCVKRQGFSTAMGKARSPFTR